MLQRIWTQPLQPAVIPNTLKLLKREKIKSQQLYLK